MALSRGLRFWLPKPKTFLGVISLQTGTELISLAMLFNKVTGMYGLLAIITGFAVSAVQVSMYIYSVLALVVLAFLIPHIRKQTPFQNLALAWLYIVDTAVNTAYTTHFAVTWYLATLSGSGPDYTPAGPDTGSAAAVAGRSDNATDMAAQQAEDTAGSIVVIVFFTLSRVYLGLVVMAYARQVLARYMSNRAAASNESIKSEAALEPFAQGSPEGEGWRGKLARAMVSVGRSYWVGGRLDDEWTRDVNSKFRRRDDRDADLEFH